jgi:plasmid stability protein
VVNLTLSIDDDLLRRARIRALEEGTSVNAVVREHLARYVAAEGPREAMARFLETSDRLDSGSGPGGRTWTREELYEEMLRRPPRPSE